MFYFMGMMGNIDERRVAVWRDEDKGLLVSTVSVTDSKQPYETAIRHPEYNDGELIVVEMYFNKPTAETGHGEWVNCMKNDMLPEPIKDLSTSGIAGMCDTVDTDSWRSFPRKEKKGGK